MKNLQKVTSIALILGLVMIFHAESRAFPGAIKNADGDAVAAENLSDAYRLHFIPLTPCGTGHFTRGIIEFAEIAGTFSLNLYSQDDPDGFVYENCPYEAYGGFQATLLVGYSPQDLVGTGFTLAGITVGDRLLVGFFQFRLVTLPPVECSYFMLGKSNQPSVIITDTPSESIQLDPFGLEGIAIVEDTISLNVTYSGGCKEHCFSLYMSPASFLESSPVQANLYLRHNSNGDACEAFINKAVSFNLRPIAELYKSLYGSYDEIIINVFEYKSAHKVSASYVPK
jgi:hypothetical protein